MSVFRGSITEYPGVIVDHFIPFNCERGRAFFLSHCHKDHMTGLNSPALYHALQSRKTNLFCSEVTQSLLLKDPEFSSLAPYLKTMPMEYPVAMAVGGLCDLPPLSFTVTLLPAGHCPGSAMFLFQGANGNVLYTGDFRLTLEETQRLRPLHSNGRWYPHPLMPESSYIVVVLLLLLFSLMPISALYLDTTFCHPSAAKLPSRMVSRDHVLKIMEKWLSGDPANVIRLQCPAFGYEHIFMGVAERLKTKVHIARWKISAYADLPAVSDCLTSDGNSTRVHNCNFRRGVPKRSGSLPCGSVPVQGKPRVLHIKPSTIWFLSTAHSLAEPSVYLPQYHAYRVLHSMHASYTEICQFVSYLQPRRVVPCVVPVGDATLTDVHSRLKVLLPHSQIVSDVVMCSGDGAASALLNREDTTELATSHHDPSILTQPQQCHEGSDDDNDDDVATSRHKKSASSFFSSGPSTSSEVDLPVMMTSHASGHGGGVIAASLARQDSSSGSVTVGSLEQTPLDLSLESEDISCDGRSDEGAKVTAESTTKAPNTVSDETFKSDSLGKLPSPGRQPEALPVEILKTIHVDSKHSRSGESKLEPKATKKARLKEAVVPDKSDHVAPCKKSRVAQERDRTSSITPRQLFDRDSAKTTTVPINYIDLTLEDSPEYIPNNDHHFIPNNDHQVTTLNNDHHCTSRDIDPIVLSSCDSEQQEATLKEGSPDILPPTPGREQVESILQRKHLTVL